jgi:prevent-host-death family protein
MHKPNQALALIVERSTINILWGSIMQYHVTLRDINQRLPHYVKAVENGDEIVITRRGKPVARMMPILSSKVLSPEQEEARKRLAGLMRKGIHLGGKPVKRDELHER